MQVLKEESFKRTYLPIAFCACCAERSCRVICFCFGCVSLFLDCSVPIFVDKNKCVLLFDCVVKCCFCILFFLDVDYLTPSQHQEEKYSHNLRNKQSKVMAKSVAVFSSGAEQKEQISGFLKFQQVRDLNNYQPLQIIFWNT